MTDAEIIAEFESIEAVQSRTMRGADYEAILRTVAAKAERPVSEVRELILDNIFARPN